MIVGIDPKETVRYVLKRERESDNPTVFLLRILTVGIHARILDDLGINIVGGSWHLGGRGGVASALPLALKHGIAGWENFAVRRDGATVTIPCDVDKDGHPTEEALRMIRAMDRIELFDAILDAQSPTEEELGKSSPESHSG